MTFYVNANKQAKISLLTRERAKNWRVADKFVQSQTFCEQGHTPTAIITSVPNQNCRSI